jgi:hypothetical protein
MNTTLIIQNAATSVVVYLELETGGPATGLTDADVTAGIKKAGAGSFSVFALTALNFTELTDGFYEVNLAAGNTDTLGLLYLSFTGADIKPSLFVGYVTTAATAPPIPSPAFTPPITAIFGYIYGSDGEPVEGTTVVARVTQQPYIIHPDTDGVLVNSDFLTTTTDETGFFTISLLTGATVEFIISDANYRRTVVIPGSTANLFDIP